MTRSSARRHFRPRAIALRIAVLAAAAGIVLGGATPASAAYIDLNGEGSSWAGPALQQWTAAVKTQGVTVNYNPNGSSVGRGDFAGSRTEFAVSEIPYRGDTADPQDISYPDFPFVMLPIASGGTAFMYNLDIGGKRVTDLKLSQDAISGIFSGRITNWSDPAIAADNPGVALPNQRLTVVVRSEGSGATAQFTLWMLRTHPDDYKRMCSQTGQCDGVHGTSYYPHQGYTNFVAQNGSTGVTQYVASTRYSIGYDEYAYAQQARFPVAQVKNAAGYYTLPDQYAVAVALHKAAINMNQNDPNYLSQDLSGVYEYADPRTYPLSMYTYELAPTTAHTGFNEAKGATLGYFDQFALCEGQRTMGQQGYSPLPMNLVLAAMDQVKKVPGVDPPTLAKMNATGQAVAAGSGNPCNNPTFKPGDDPANNILLDTAPFPPGCNLACAQQWVRPGVTPVLAGAGQGGGQGGAAAAGGAGAKGAGGSGGAGSAGGGADGAAGGAGAGGQQCDADTGECTGAVSSASGGNVNAVPTVMAGSVGWTSPQTILVVLALLVALLLVGPPVVARLVSRNSPGRRP